MEYTDAKESLLQAARKAPVAAQGFRIQCNKWAVIVRLLLGEIPERTVFMQRGMKKALRPYFELTNVSILKPENTSAHEDNKGNCWLLHSTCEAPGLVVGNAHLLGFLKFNQYGSSYMLIRI